MGIFENCMEMCKAEPGVVAFPDCLDERVLAAATRLKKEKLATPILVQSPFAVTHKIQGTGKSFSGFTVIDHTNNQLLEENIHNYTRILEAKGKSVALEKIEAAMRCSLAASAMMVRQNQVDVGVAGNLSSTADVIRAGISILPRKQKNISSFFLMVSPDEAQHYILADCAVVPEPDADTLADIAIASAEKAKNLLGEEPRVAMLSFSTKGSAQHHRPSMVREAVLAARKKAPGIVIDGELQLDAAVVPGVASLKAPGSQLGGNANVLVFPSLEAGNIGYKMLQRMAGYTALGPFLQGFEGGWHDLSRGCSAEDIFKVAVVGICMQRGNTAVTPTSSQKRITA